MDIIEENLIHFKTKAAFEAALGNNASPDENGNYGSIPGTSLVFVKETSSLWTHGWEISGELDSEDIDEEVESADDTLSTTAVRTTPQILTNAEKLQVRANIGIESTQVDWNQTDNTKNDYIKNKPIVKTYTNLQEELNGTSNSLVTTGDKYTWNKKQNPLGLYIDEDGDICLL